MSTIKIEVLNAKTLAEALKKSPERMRANLATAYQYSSILVQRVMKEEAPVDQGELRGSIDRRAVTDGVVIWPRANYAAAVNDGTKPHPVGWQGIQSLEKWAVHHGMPAVVGYAIAWSIRKKGTKANPFVDRTKTRTESEVKETFDKAVDNVLRES